MKRRCGVLMFVGGVLLCGCDSRPVASVDAPTPVVDVSDGPPRPREGERFAAFRERWNAWVEAVPEEQKLFPDLVNITAEIDTAIREDFETRLSEPPDYVLHEARPWNRYWTEAPIVFDALDAELNEVYEITRRAWAGVQIPTTTDEGDEIELPTDQLVDRVLDQGPAVRAAAQYLTAHAAYLVFTGDVDAGVNRLRAVAGIADRVDELPGETAWLVSHAIRSLFRGAVIDLVEYEPLLFTDEQLDELQHLMIHDTTAGAGEVFAMRRFVAEEDWRKTFHGLKPGMTSKELRDYYWEFVDVTAGMGSMFGPTIPVPDRSDDRPLAPLEEQVALHGVLHDAMKEDLSADPAEQQQPRFMQAAHEYFGDEDAARYLPVRADVRLWRSYLGFVHRSRYQATNATVILAIHRHRLRHGQWPESLEAIDPDTLPVPAIDLYSGEPLRYSLAGGKPRLWALGADRDDDGGRRGDEVTVSRWFALGEWEAMSEQERGEHDGDIRLMN